MLTLDWSHLSTAYQSGATNAGTVQSFTVGSNTVSSVFGIDGNTTAANTFISGTPTPSTYNTAITNGTLYTNGGTTDGELALQIGIALASTTADDVKFTLNFTQPVYGATFQLFDLDYTSGSFTDQVRNILGTGGTGTVQPTLTGSTDNSVGNVATNLLAGYSNSITGTAASAQNAGAGNATVTFANNVPITSISFVYGDNTNALLGNVAPAATTTQIIALSNVSWSTVSGVSVPEPETFRTVGLGLAGLAAVIFRRHRRG